MRPLLFPERQKAAHGSPGCPSSCPALQAGLAGGRHDPRRWARAGSSPRPSRRSPPALSGLTRSELMSISVALTLLIFWFAVVSIRKGLVSPSHLEWSFLEQFWRQAQKSAQLKRETVPVMAAAGATGLAVIDVATNVLQAKVIAAAGSDEKCKLAMQRGAQSSVNCSQGGLREAVRRLVGSGGVNVVIDAVGGDIFLEPSTAIAGLKS